MTVCNSSKVTAYSNTFTRRGRIVRQGGSMDFFLTSVLGLFVDLRLRSPRRITQHHHSTHVSCMNGYARQLSGLGYDSSESTSHHIVHSTVCSCNEDAPPPPNHKQLGSSHRTEPSITHPRSFSLLILEQVLKFAASLAKWRTSLGEWSESKFTYIPVHTLIRSSCSRSFWGALYTV